MIGRLLVLFALTHICIAHAKSLASVDLSHFTVFAILDDAHSEQALVGLTSLDQQQLTFAICNVNPKTGSLEDCNLDSDLWLPGTADTVARLKLQFQQDLRMGYAGAQFKPSYLDDFANGAKLGLAAGTLSAVGIKPLFVSMIVVGGAMLASNREPTSLGLPSKSDLKLAGLFPAERQFPHFLALPTSDRWLSFDLVKTALFLSLGQTKSGT